MSWQKEGKMEIWRSEMKGCWAARTCWLTGQCHGHRRALKSHLCKTVNKNRIILIPPYLLHVFLNAQASLARSKCALNYVSLIYKQPFGSTSSSSCLDATPGHPRLVQSFPLNLLPLNGECSCSAVCVVVNL